MADQRLPALSAGANSAPAADDLTYSVDVSDTTDHASGTSKYLRLDVLNGNSGTRPGGRLTLESGVDISTSDQASKSTLYYTPSVSDYVRIYNGTSNKEYVFTERSLALSGLTSGKNYDVFIYDNSGTLTLELSAAWSNDTTRADALAWQSGIGWVKSGTATRLWLGTIRTTGTNTTEDKLLQRYVWNFYNPVLRVMKAIETTDQWTYGSTSWQQFNANSAMKVEYVSGVAATHVDAIVLGTNYIASGSAHGGLVGVGVDSVTAVSGLINGSYVGNSATSFEIPSSATYRGQPGLGYHYLAALERAYTAVNVDFLGDDGGIVQSGIFATIIG